MSHVHDSGGITDLDLAAAYALGLEKRKKWINLLLSTNDNQLAELLERWSADTGHQIPKNL